MIYWGLRLEIIIYNLFKYYMNNNDNNFKNNNKSLEEWIRTVNIYPLLILIVFLILLGLSLMYFFNKSYKTSNN